MRHFILTAMLKLWCFNNTFTKQLLPFSLSYWDNQSSSQQIRAFKQSFNGLQEIINTEIINNYTNNFRNKYFNASLSIKENNYKYPFSQNYVAPEYSEVNLNILLKNAFQTRTNFIKEKFIIRPHYKSPHSLHIDYMLKIDDNVITKKTSIGSLSSTTLNIIFTEDQKAGNLLKKVKYYSKNYPVKVE